MMKRCQQLIYSEKSVLMFDLMIYTFFKTNIFNAGSLTIKTNDEKRAAHTHTRAQRARKSTRKNFYSSGCWLLLPFFAPSLSFAHHVCLKIGICMFLSLAHEYFSINWKLLSLKLNSKQNFSTHTHTHTQYTTHKLGLIYSSISRLYAITYCLSLSLTLLVIVDLKRKLQCWKLMFPLYIFPTNK